MATDNKINNTEISAEMIEALSNYNSPAHQAAIEKCLADPIFLTKVDNKGRNPLHIASIAGILSLVKILVHVGRTLRTTQDDQVEHTAFALVRAICNDSRSNPFLRQKRLLTLKWLLSIIVLQDHDGSLLRKSALYTAAMCGDLEIVKLLIEVGHVEIGKAIIVSSHPTEESRNFPDQVITYLKTRSAIDKVLPPA